MSREVISLHIGQTGVNIGNECWKLFCADHNISVVDGARVSDAIEDKYYSTFFSETKEKKYVPRAVFADLDPTYMEDLQRDYSSLYNHTCLIKGNEDAAGNYTRGHYTIGKEILDVALDRIRLLAEDCDNMQGFMFTHSIGGGTGSGFTAAVMDRLAVEYSKKIRMNVAVIPSSTYSAVVTEPYNAVLALHSMVELSDLTMIVDNTAIANICQKRLHNRWPTLTDINSVIAQAISNVTYSTRCPGLINTSLEEIKNNLVPYARLVFLSCAMSPYLATHRAYEKSLTVDDMTRAVFSGENSLCEINPQSGKYLASSLMYYGDLKAQEVQSALNDIRTSNTVQFIEGVKASMKCGIVPYQPSTAPNGTLAKVSKSVTMLANTTAMCSVFKKITNDAHGMLDKYAHFFHLAGEGLPRYELTLALEDMKLLAKDYDEIQSYTESDEEELPS
jgi:tubulin alpha